MAEEEVKYKSRVESLEDAIKTADSYKAKRRKTYFDTKTVRGNKKLVLNAIGILLVEDLARIHASIDEIAHVLGVERSVLTRGNKEVFMPIYEAGMSDFRVTLRRNQLELSKSNANMAIWLGKNYLEQRDPDKQVKEGEINYEDLSELGKLLTSKAKSMKKAKKSAEEEMVDDDSGSEDN